MGKANSEKLTDYDWKLYKDFKEVIGEIARASQGEKETDGRVFAIHIVSKLLASKPPKQIVFGHMTGLFAIPLLLIQNVFCLFINYLIRRNSSS